ncbi:hypothetical protein M0804_008604 [Polistes exclamans]|nr:hypothetical protein M0804_008604 [Polistes exclamans]
MALVDAAEVEGGGSKEGVGRDGGVVVM